MHTAILEMFFKFRKIQEAELALKKQFNNLILQWHIPTLKISDLGKFKKQKKLERTK